MAVRRFYEFGPFRLDPARRLLSRQGDVIPLTSKVLDTLLMLVENRGRAVSKEELIKSVWPDTFVEEGNLTQNISTLRKVLGESPNDHVYIETIPKCGYRFVAGVTERQSGSLMSSRRAYLRAAGLFAAIGITVAIWFFNQRARAPASSVVVVPLTSYPGDEWHPSFSPDGNQVAFARNARDRENFDIYIKLIGTDQPLRLTTDPADDLYPAWSPDGRHIAFARCITPAAPWFPRYPRPRATNYGIFIVPVIGGPERKLTETAALGVFPRRLLAWSYDSNGWLPATRSPQPSPPAYIWFLSHPAKSAGLHTRRLR